MANEMAALLIVAALIMVSYQLVQHTALESATGGLAASKATEGAKGCVMNDVQTDNGSELQAQCDAFCGDPNRTTDYLIFNNGRSECSCLNDCTE